MPVIERSIQQALPELAELAASGNEAAFLDALDDLTTTVKALFETQAAQARWPKGSPNGLGGQFMPKDGKAGGGGTPKVGGDVAKLPYADQVNALDSAIRRDNYAKAAEALDDITKQLAARDRRKLVKGVKDSLSGVLSLIKDTWNDAADFVSDFTDDLLDGDTFRDMLKFAEDTGKQAMNLAKKANSALEPVRKLGDSASQKAADIATEIRESALGVAVSQAASSVREKAQALSKSIGDSEFMQQARDLVQATKNLASQAASTTSDSIKTKAQELRDSAQAAVDKAQKQLDQLSQTDIGKQAMQVAKDLGVTLEDGAKLTGMTAALAQATLANLMIQAKAGLVGDDAPVDIIDFNEFMNQQLRHQTFYADKMEKLEAAVHEMVQRKKLFWEATRLTEGTQVKVPKLA